MIACDQSFSEKTACVLHIQLPVWFHSEVFSTSCIEQYIMTHFSFPGFFKQMYDLFINY